MCGHNFEAVTDFNSRILNKITVHGKKSFNTTLFCERCRLGFFYVPWVSFQGQVQLMVQYPDSYRLDDVQFSLSCTWESMPLSVNSAFNFFCNIEIACFPYFLIFSHIEIN